MVGSAARAGGGGLQGGAAGGGPTLGLAMVLGVAAMCLRPSDREGGGPIELETCAQVEAGHPSTQFTALHSAGVQNKLPGASTDAASSDQIDGDSCRRARLPQ